MEETKKKTRFNPVKCRICGRLIDRNTEIEGEDWIMPSKNWFYCKECYQNWKSADTHTDEDWAALIYDFLARDLKVSYDYYMCEAQRKKFITQHHFTNKGIYFTLKYFYELKQGDWSKGNGGIGIVPYIYKEATGFWTDMEAKKRGIMKAIEQQIRERAMRPIKEIKKSAEQKAQKERWSLDNL